MDWDDEHHPTIKHDCKYKQLYQNFIDLLTKFDLVQMVKEATRKKNILDYFITSNPTLIQSVKVLPGISDHDMILSCTSCKPQILKQPPRTKIQFHKADWPNFEKYMENAKDKFIKEKQNKSVETLWQELKTIVEIGISKFIPTKQFSGKKSLPWISQSIKRQIRKRDKLYNQQKHSKNPSIRTKFLKCKSAVKAAIKKAHLQYLENVLGISDDTNENTSVKSKFSTQILFAYIKNTRQDNSGVAPLKCPKQNKVFSDTQTKTEILNSQFKSVFTKNSPLSLGQLCKESLNNIDVPVMPEIKLSLNGIIKQLANLNPSKAAGPDTIKPIVLKNLKIQIAPIVMVIFEKSLETGTVPLDWTKANVCPIFKKGDNSNPANYRPISLTCILCKVLEHIVASNICKHFSENNILYDLQHGFRDERSCETQLLQLIEDISRNLDQGLQSDLILLDFSKAFDKVNHVKLLHKLHQHGIQNKTLAWIKSFLIDRSQSVVLDGHISSIERVTSGVPQGSVLGPILFLLYINDLPNNIKSKVRLFADDTAVYLTIRSNDDSKILQGDLEQLQVWEKTWDMEFNPSKCEVLHITKSQKPILNKYVLHGEILKPTTNAKYLGVTITNNLSWNTHIENISKKANRTLGFIKRNIKTKHQGIRATAYNTLVRPQLEYASCVWSPHTQSNVHTLERVQRRAARWVSDDYSRHSSVTEMYSQLNWNTLESRRLHTRLFMFYKIIHHKVAVPLPPYILHPVRPTRNVHPHSFIQLQPRSDTYKFSFFPATIIYWNNLPPDIASIQDSSAFKKALLNHHF